MIQLDATGKRVMLTALRDAAAEVALQVGDAEPANERYARVPCAEWEVTDDQLVGRECTFMFSGPVGRVTGYQVLSANGECLFSEQFENAYDFSEYGGRLRVVPIITLTNQ